MKAIARFIFALGALLISGCWMSGEPLMPEEDMDWPQFEAVYISETWATAEDLEDVVTIARQPGHYEFSQTPLFDKESTSRYLLNFDEIKTGWYLVQISPVVDVNVPHVWEDYPNHTYYELLRSDGESWQEFSFWPGCPEVAEDRRGNLQQLDHGCSFSDYTLLRQQALIATGHLFFNPGSFDPMADASVSSAHYERAFNIHRGAIVWSEQYDPEKGMGNWFDPHGYLALLGIAVTVVFGLMLLAVVWFSIKRLAARGK